MKAKNMSDILIFFLVVLIMTFIIAASCDSKKSKCRLEATYYHDRYEGRHTANGEIFTQDSFTCACNEFPFDTLLLVIDEDTNKKVTVRVNDRMLNNGSIDLSKAAAKQLGMLKIGRKTVTVEVMNEDN